MQNSNLKQQPAVVNALNHLDSFQFCPNYGNLGDILIAEAEYQAFDANQLEYSILNPETPPSKEFDLVYGGGGLFVRHWNYQKVLTLFKNPGLKRAVILPSSFRDCPDVMTALDERFTVFCREKESYEYCLSQNNKARFELGHDMTIGLNLDLIKDFFASSKVYEEDGLNVDDLARIYQPVYETLRQLHSSLTALLSKTITLHPLYGRLAFFLRRDEESALKSDAMSNIKELANRRSLDLSPLVCSACFDKAITRALSAQFLSGIGRADTIVTDRLHVGIAATLLGRKVFWLDNDYGKISGVYRNSLSNCSNIEFIEDLRDAPPKLDLEQSPAAFNIEAESYPDFDFFLRFAARTLGGHAPMVDTIKLGSALTDLSEKKDDGYSFSEKICSVKNRGDFKIITLLGLQLRLKRKPKNRP